MPVSRAAWAAAHDDLHSLEDVRRRAEDAQSGLSYEGLLSIYLNKQHDLVKKTSGSHRQNSAGSYVERYQSGEGLVFIRPTAESFYGLSHRDFKLGCTRVPIIST